jgi:hypothetical protein
MLLAEVALAEQPGLVGPEGCLQIPGPNPILTPGPEDAWDGRIIEASDAFKDFGTYYLYYHGAGKSGYQLGVATASHPLGPFRKHSDQPILPRGRDGSWESVHVACAMIVREGTGKYTMWYSGRGASEKHQKWSVGLATADNPLGPWTKYRGNPIIKDFGYVGGVVRFQGKYHLYTAHPIGSIAPDYSPIALAMAEKPEGPWEICPRNPVMRQGECGDWDDGGFSEAEVLLHGGVLHMFYGGAKLYSPRILTRESVGYAYSTDGIQFTKYLRNPVAARQAEPNAAAYAEVHSIIEPPFVYVYHTLRYERPWRDRFRAQFPDVEDLGMQVLVLQRPFSLDMPVLRCDRLQPGEITSLDRCRTICVGDVDRVAVTVECCYPRDAIPLTVHVRSSPDGERYDTADLHTFECDVGDLQPGETFRQTFGFRSTVRFIKVLLQNADHAKPITNVRVTATLSG